MPQHDLDQRRVALLPGSEGETRTTFDLDELTDPGVQVIVGAPLGSGPRFSEVGPSNSGCGTRTVPSGRGLCPDAGSSENSLVVATFYRGGLTPKPRWNGAVVSPWTTTNESIGSHSIAEDRDPILPTT